MFDHVEIKVVDLARSRSFYTACLREIGYGMAFEKPDIAIGFGPDPHNMFVICQAGPETLLTQHVHLAFKAKTVEAVKAFHRAALLHGGVDNGAPGPRLEYEPDYYAAFVLDPDGNNVEAVTGA